MQYAIEIFPAVFDRLFSFEFLHLFVFALQLLQSQFYAANAGLVKDFEGKLSCRLS